ncbi:MAG: hypothetical protein OXU23_10810 [Candidatus Poribacteria bacterium]|nr:hypothetical protein [Candidatus Poribacteria bacterium]
MRLLTASLLFFLFLFVSIGANAKILFTSEVPGFDITDPTDGIYVMEDDGSNVIPLINHGRAWAPKWAPDDKSIVFAIGASLRLMNADGTNIRRITVPPKNAGDFYPAYSPDGKSIVFKRLVSIPGEPHEHSLNVLNLKTGKIKEIADVHGVSPDWSPDGKYIVCGGAINVDGLGSSIWIMNANGSNLRKIIPSQRVGNSILSVSRPRWSPDSQKIVYATMKYHWRNIAPDVDALIREEFRYIICDKNGNTLKTLNIPKDFEHGTLAWMDNGKSIVFGARKYPINEPPPPLEQYPVMNIYTYHIQSGKLTQLTDTERNESGVDWISDDVLSVSPKGKMQTQWGAIKKFLQSRSEAFKSLSQDVLYFLRNEH